MSVLKTFRPGGIHPSENKLTTGREIRTFPAPEQVSIPLNQHIGAPPKILVEKGEQVKVGQIIARGEGFISANIHASVSGKVIKIGEVVDMTGYKRNAVSIKVEGDEWIEEIDTSDQLVRETTLDRQEIIRKINEAGIVGMGGATFPTHVKLMLPRGERATHLIVNGAECEPYLTSDHILMLEKADQILVGATIMMKALSVDHAIVGIENNKPDAIAHMSAHAAQFPGIRVQGLKVKYPPCSTGRCPLADCPSMWALWFSMSGPCSPPTKPYKKTNRCLKGWSRLPACIWQNRVITWCGSEHLWLH